MGLVSEGAAAAVSSLQTAPPLQVHLSQTAGRGRGEEGRRRREEGRKGGREDGKESVDGKMEGRKEHSTLFTYMYNVVKSGGRKMHT